MSARQPGIHVPRTCIFRLTTVGTIGILSGEWSQETRVVGPSIDTGVMSLEVS